MTETLLSDPKTPSEELEALYWQYFLKREEDDREIGLHEVCLRIAVHPNLSRNMIKKISIHTMEVAKNPAIPLLLVEDPGWMSRNINPKILAIARQLNG